MRPGVPAASLSCGVALYPIDGTTSPLLLENADAALYRAKEAGRVLKHRTLSDSARPPARLRSTISLPLSDGWCR